ncbi:MAG: RNA polymerase sigma factor [Myxococcota bacterium]
MTENERLLGDLLQAHGAAVYRYCRSVSRRDDADDLFQETMLAALGGPPLVTVTSPRAWLFTIARHAAIRLGRKRAGEPERLEPLLELGQEAGWGRTDPETDAIASQDRHSLQRALEDLNAADREVVLLRDIEELSVRETAAIMETTEAAVRTRLHRARLRLMKRMRAK